jgi:hypothetical protein
MKKHVVQPLFPMISTEATLFGFGANNKKIISMQPRIAQGSIY